MKIVLLIVAALAFLVVLAIAPAPVLPILDFQVLFHADAGLLRGITLYDHTGQVNMIARAAQVPPDQVYVLPFPYPPWYALATVWLARLPIQAAVRVWLGINLLLLLASIWFLTEGWQPVRRTLAVLAAILFAPVLGSLYVGQYDFPVLLGAALMLYALRHERAALAALAAALLTFKPHIGAPILIVVLIHLWLRKDAFEKRALGGVGIIGAALFAVGFLASPLWPVDYFHSLTGFRDVSQCHQCASIPMALAGLLHGGFDQALPFAALLLVIAAAWLVWQWRSIRLRPTTLISSAVLVTLAVSPYLQKYDYVLLVAPMIILAGESRGWDWLWIGLAYLLPLVGVIVWGPEAGLTLVLAEVLLLGLQIIHTAKAPRSPSIPAEAQEAH